jgi:thiol peroxidase
LARITFHGEIVTLAGDLPSVGARAPAFCLTDANMREITSADFNGRKKLLICLTSVDTPICAAVARKFNAKADRLKETALLLVSADLPFAQCRFCASEGLTKIMPLSSFRSDLGQTYGLAIQDGILQGLLSRALIAIDENDRIIHTQQTAELTEEPDYESLFLALS